MNPTGKAALKSYRDLLVWQKSMDLVEHVYRLAQTFPKDELYGLRSQMQRAAVSVPANIAEGYGRSHRGDYVHHLSIANGSLKELETLISVAGRLNYLSEGEVTRAASLLDETGKLLHCLIKSLK